MKFIGMTTIHEGEITMNLDHCTRRGYELGSKTSVLPILMASILMLTVNEAMALPVGFNVFTDTYPIWVEDTEHDCLACHQGRYPTSGNGPRNPYGQRWNVVLAEKRAQNGCPPANNDEECVRQSREQALVAIEDEDSDGDGVSNVAEILQGFLPGHSNVPDDFANPDEPGDGPGGFGVEPPSAKVRYDFSLLQIPSGSIFPIGKVGERAAGRRPVLQDLNEGGEYVGRLIAGKDILWAFSSTGVNTNTGPNDSQASGINDENVVVGQRPDPTFGGNRLGGFQTSPNGQISSAFSPSMGGIFDLLTNDINNAQVNVGKSQAKRPYRANLDGSFIIELTEVMGEVYDINEFNQVVGRFRKNQNSWNYDNRAFFCHKLIDCEPIDLGTLREDNSGISRAFELNDFSNSAGGFVEFVGYASADGTDKLHAAYGQVIFSGESPLFSEFYVDLGTLCTNNASCSSVARDINRNFAGGGSRGKIVGTSETNSGEKHAFVMFDNAELKVMFNLNELILSGDTDFFMLNGDPAFTLMEAAAINDEGVIVGIARVDIDKTVQFENGEVANVFRDDIYGFRLTPQPLPELMFEAENLLLDTYLIENNDAASGGKLISLRNASGNTGSASFEFTAPSGSYDIVVGYLDETDGTAELVLQVNGSAVDSWVLDEDLGSADPVAQTFTERTIQGVALETGDTLSVVGTRDFGEWARVDFVQILPAD